MLLAVPALAAEVPATLKLDQVTVNPAGAQVQRVGEVTVPAGTHEIIIDNLPAGIPASSIQVEGKAAPGAEIGTVDVSLIQLDPAQQMQGERKRLQDELDALGRDRARQERTRADADFRRATLERLTASSGSSDKAAMTPEQLMAVLSLTSKELETFPKPCLTPKPPSRVSTSASAWLNARSPNWRQRLKPALGWRSRLLPMQKPR